MNRVVIVSPRAEIDVDDFFFYLAIECDNVAAANRFLNALSDTYACLVEFPDIGLRQHFDHTQLTGLRMWPIPGFDDRLIYYIVRDTFIDVVRVLGGPQDRETILQDD